MTQFVSQKYTYYWYLTLMVYMFNKCMSVYTYYIQKPCCKNHLTLPA